MAGIWPHQYAPHRVTPSDSHGIAAAVRVGASNPAIIPHATSPRARSHPLASGAPIVGGERALASDPHRGDA